MRSIPATLSIGLLGIAFLGLAGAAPSAKAAEFFPYYLTKGQDYALEAYGYCDGGTVELINPAGATTVGLGACTDPDEGQEFRAAYTGTFQVRVTNGREGDVRFDLSKDCRRDVKTLCTLRPGTTTNGSFAWLYDGDWLKVSLVRGHTYSFTDRPGTSWDSGSQLPARLALHDAAGKVLATADPEMGGDTLTFRAKVTGTYFLGVYNVSDVHGPYLLRMTAR